MWLNIMNTDLNKLVQVKYRGLLFSTHFLKQSAGLKSYCDLSQEQKKKSKPTHT